MSNKAFSGDDGEGKGGKHWCAAELPPLKKRYSIFHSCQQRETCFLLFLKSSNPEKRTAFVRLFLSFLNDVLLLFLKNVSSIRFFCFLNFVFWGIWGCFHFKRRVQLPYSLLGLLLQYQRCLPPRDVNFAIVS